MSQIIPEEIEHLDFAPEKEEEPVHFKDPIDPSKRWCGTGSNAKTYSESQGKHSVSELEITCVPCLHLFIRLGARWWWNTHNQFYGSSCRSRPEISHNCGV